MGHQGLNPFSRGEYPGVWGQHLLRGSLLNSGRRVVIDGGTGLRLLGRALNGKRLSHQPLSAPQPRTLGPPFGHPFFVPIYQETTENLVDGWPPAFQAMTRVFDSHMGDGFFPVAFDHLKARIDYINRLAHGPLDLDGVRIEAMPLNHPQGGFGFRFQEEGHSMAFFTDNVLLARHGQKMAEFAEFVRGVDLLIHDAQYLPSDMAERRGRGHSTYEEAVALAREAEVRNLILTHHDPSRSDRKWKRSSKWPANWPAPAASHAI